jgi:hypothetical protein
MKALVPTILGALAICAIAPGPCAAWEALVYDDSVTIGVRRPYWYVVPYRGLYSGRRYRLRGHHRRNMHFRGTYDHNYTR